MSEPGKFEPAPAQQAEHRFTSLENEELSSVLMDDDAVDWLSRMQLEQVRLLPYAFSKRHSLVAIDKEESGTNILCVKRPPFDIYAELKRRINGPIQFHEVSSSEFEEVLRRAHEKGESAATQMVDDISDELDLSLLASEVPVSTDLLEASDDAPVVKLINALLTEAIREEASDIHLEVFEKRSLVRFRVDGVLRDVVEPKRALHGALISRLKVMAELDIAEKRLPQDGRISLSVGGRPVDVRVSSLPTQYGERMVLRLLDKQGSKMMLDSLGMQPEGREQFDEMIQSPHGIVLVTGPTGSGKTTTLYAGLGEMDRQRLNIMTVEDPIEYDLDGVGQTQVHSKIGMTFARGLRAILRQDPDVVLIGEIRDLETAQIAVQASLTGHLVLATLHTNTAIGAITRLVDMGVEEFLIASSLLGVLAQRLVRTLCEDCKQAVTPTMQERQLLGVRRNEENVQIYKSIGCGKCDNTGYRGRQGIYELVVVDEQIRRMIHDEASEADIQDYVRQSTPSLMRNGLDMVLRGRTSLDEVIRVSRDQ